MLDRIKTILLVSIVTLLVWIFAEAESLQRRELHFKVQFVSDAPTDRFIESDSSPDGQNSLKVYFSGSAAALSQAEGFAAASDKNPVKLSIGNPAIPATPGENVVELRDALRNVPQFAGLGLSIERVEPPSLRVRIDNLEARIAHIAVKAGETPLEGVPEAKPATAKLYFPAELASRVGSSPEVFATLRADDIGRLVPGKQEVIPQVRLEPPAALQGVPGVRLEPPAAQVTLTLRARQATTELTGVPVQVRVAPGELSRWEISMPEQDRFIPKVTVSGPADLIDQIKRSELKIVATVSLSFEDLEKGIGQKEITFCDLPSLLKFETDTRLVRVSIKKR
ncbi:MAG: hypothetical protein U0573_01430 [Phycisphaerales bacterium]|nr:hypothetical protein [Planctomycetota bacterium]